MSEPKSPLREALPFVVLLVLLVAVFMWGHATGMNRCLIEAAIK